MGYEKSAHLYDLFDAKENIDFFFHYASEAGEVLDVGAGTGRIAIPLAERGVQVFCVEPSPAMRRRFEKELSKTPRLSRKIELIAGDAMSFDLRRTFPAAFLSATFDHFLDDRERLSSLANIAKHLMPQDKLIFDVLLRLGSNGSSSSAEKIIRGDTEFRRFVANRLLPNDRMEIKLVYEIYGAGKLKERIEERSLVGIIQRERLHRLLEETGFEVKREFGNYDFSSYKEGGSLLIIEAAKKR